MTHGTVHVTVPVEAEGSRLDQFLVRQLDGHTRSSLTRLIREGRVLVDGLAASKPGLGVRAGMQVEIAIPAPPSEDLLHEPIPLDIVLEDDDLLVVNKPAGLVVHPGHGCRSGTLVNALLGRGTPLAAAGGRQRPGIVHRLDRETSGVMVVAKTDAAHRALSLSFARREVRKQYTALVWGQPEPSSGTISRRIGRSRTHRTRMSVRAPRGREATTHFKTVQCMPGFALLEVEIETGRTHQIRVHMQALNHSVVGDSRYGGRAWKGLIDPIKRKAVRELSRIALHATRLSFPHPTRGEQISVGADLPDDFLSLLAVLRQRQ